MNLSFWILLCTLKRHPVVVCALFIFVKYVKLIYSNLHPHSSLHHVGPGPVVLPADGKCKETVKLAAQTDGEIQTLSTVQHQLGQLQHHLHLHSCNVQHHAPELAVKSPGVAVPVMSRTIKKLSLEYC